MRHYLDSSVNAVRDSERPEFRFKNCHCEGTEAISSFSMRLPRLRAVALQRAGTHLAGARNDRMGRGFGF